VLSSKPWKPEAVLRLLLGIFLCVAIGTLLSLLMRGANTAKTDLSLGRMLLGVLSFQGAALLLAWRFVREHDLRWVEAFGFRNRAGSAVLFGTLAVIVFFPMGRMLQLLSNTILTWLHLDPTAQTAVEVLRLASRGPGLIAFGLVTIVVVPLAEEMVFRGILYPAIKGYGFPRLALWGTSALFAAIHFNLAIFLPLLLLALVLTWLYEKTDNLLAPIAAHSLFNAVNLGLFILSDDFTTKLPAQP
jgi:membrane protease YdiL (CAAX protease family)